MDMMCNSCHSEEKVGKDKIPEIDYHPDNMLITNSGRDNKHETNYFPMYNPLTGAKSSVGNISCPSCHNIHQWDPRFFKKGEGVNTEGTSNNSFLRAQTYNLLCIDCHGLDALFRFKYYHDPIERVEKKPGPFIPVKIK